MSDFELRRLKRQTLTDPSAKDAYIAALERAVGVKKIDDKLEIQQFLVLSTGHMTFGDDGLLYEHTEYSPETYFPITVYPYEYGYWIILPYSNTNPDYKKLNELREVGFSLNFIKCLMLCYDQHLAGCKFDRDGPTYEDKLTLFEW